MPLSWGDWYGIQSRRSRSRLFPTSRSIGSGARPASGVAVAWSARVARDGIAQPRPISSLTLVGFHKISDRPVDLRLIWM
jgi:hypothetical protein